MPRVGRLRTWSKGIQRQHRVPYHFPLVSPRRSLRLLSVLLLAFSFRRAVSLILSVSGVALGHPIFVNCAEAWWNLVSHGLSECWLNVSWQRLRHKSELRSEREHRKTVPD
jgi:hypothetical protein